MPDGQPWPRISIVTPSFNQAEFLEETIRSVLLQAYPNLEYFIMDGGSNDGTVGIIKKYAPWLTGWLSEKDRGQSHAINKGFARCTGDLMTFQNSDDYYLPGAFADAATRFAARRDASVVVGGFFYVDGHKRREQAIAARVPHGNPIDLVLTPVDQWRLHQVSTFYSRAVLDRVGRRVREDLNWVMDRELLYRACNAGPVLISNHNYAIFRWHPQGKSISNYLKADLEYAALHDSYHYDEPEKESLRRAIANRRRAIGHIRFARQADGLGPAIKALCLGLRYVPSLVRERGYLATWVKVLLRRTAGARAASLKTSAV
jgi:glycosyltransferase involved in cell wall biosynthesis